MFIATEHSLKQKQCQLRKDSLTKSKNCIYLVMKDNVKQFNNEIYC